MNEIIKVTYNEDGSPTVSGRELHEALEVKEKYTDWFKRMCTYGFEETEDYSLVSEISETNNPKNPHTIRTDHALTISMAKEICMLQRTEKGKLMPFQKYVDAGLFELKESINQKSGWGGTQTMITPKGKETFRLLCIA